MYLFLYSLGMLTSIVQFVWIFTLRSISNSVFTLGIYLVLALFIFHFSFYLIKRNIFDRGLTPETRSLTI